MGISQMVSIAQEIFKQADNPLVRSFVRVARDNANSHPGVFEFKFDGSGRAVPPGAQGPRQGMKRKGGGVPPPPYRPRFASRAIKRGIQRTKKGYRFGTRKRYVARRRRATVRRRFYRRRR